MGYYTRYKLEFDETNINIENFKAEFEKLTDYFFPLGTVTWYNWSEDMAKISRNYPNILFTLSGEGEEAGDLWKAYFKDGNVQECKAIITFEPFDESKMKTYI